MSRPNLTSEQSRKTTRNVLIAAASVTFAGIAGLPLEKFPPLEHFKAKAHQANLAFATIVAFLMVSHMLNWAEDAYEQVEFSGTKDIYFWTFIVWNCAVPLTVGVIALTMVAPLLLTLVMAGLSAATVWYGLNNLL